MKIEILQQQELFHLDEKSIEAFALWIMKKVEALDDSFHWSELSLVFMDDQIRELNLQWFKKDTVTDVISFAYPAEASTGEVIVNAQQAVEEGKLRISADYELALYIAHGCHHLMGAEDDTPARKKSMLDLEQKWVEEYFTQNLCGPFFL
ncbi:rRNA maturation RNase YbeY [Kiritimatiellaeota bacterium B1221]|nr:rRNA maturation RNase YbeY [Kiritimatiellaeota bacterium B1221]